MAQQAATDSFETDTKIKLPAKKKKRRYKG